MDAWAVGSIGVVLVALIGSAFVPRRSRTLREGAERAASKVGLALTDDVAPLVILRRTRERRLSLIIGALTWVGAFVVVQLVQGPRYEASTIWFTNGSIVLGGAIGSAVAALIDSRRRVAADARRVARGRVVALTDYVPPVEVHSARAAIATALAVLTIAVVATIVPVVTGALIGGMCLASVVLFEVAGRWIVRQRQQASNPTELAWDDALRSVDLKAVELAPFASALYAVIGVLFGVAELDSPMQGFIDACLLVLTVGLLVVVVVRVSRSGDRDRYFLQRLWPGTAAQLAENERPMEVQR